MSLLDEISALLDDAGTENAAVIATRILEATQGAGPEQAALAHAMAQRRIAGIPLAHVLGRETFMGLDLIVDEDVLAPREETEILGRAAVEFLQTSGFTAPRVMDICCGSGNLACAIATRIPTARVWAADLTESCVTLARRNAVHVRVDDRVVVVQGDLFSAFDAPELQSAVDVIVCNPPYISNRRLEGDRAELLKYEPREAFDGGPYGLSIHQRVVRDAVRFLRPGGVLAFEIGVGQERQVRTLFERTKSYSDVRALHDADGQARVVLGSKAA